MGGPANHPKLDRFSIETPMVLEIPHFRKPAAWHVAETAAETHQSGSVDQRNPSTHTAHTHNLPTYLSIYLPTYLSIYLSTYQSIYLSTYLSTYLSI